MRGAPQTMRRDGWLDGGKRSALAACAAIALAIAVVAPVYRLQDLSWLRAIGAAVTFVIPGVLLGWAAWRLLMRPRRTGSPAIAVIAHVLAAVAFGLVWTAAFAGLSLLLGSELSMGYVRGGAVWQLFWGVVIYVVLVLAVRSREALRKKELAAAAAELQALRAQLDPHFLFNTLHSLTQLVREDPVATQQALERFGELMRYVLSAGREAKADVALDQEMEFIRNYLALERLRLGDRLRVVEEVEPDALELAVPPLLLQPLVENAVRHGVAPRREGGELRIRARTDGRTLVVEVDDDGRGCAPGAWCNSEGLGIKAVERQLGASFPSSGRLAVDAGPNGGFRARMTMEARLPERRR